MRHGRASDGRGARLSLAFLEEARRTGGRGMGLLIVLAGLFALYRGRLILREGHVAAEDFEAFLNKVLGLENVIHGPRARLIGVCHLIAGVLAILMGLYALFGGTFVER